MALGQLPLRATYTLTKQLVATNWPVILLGLALAWLVHNKFQRGLARIPGPWLASFTKLWRVWISSKGDLFATYMRLHKQYGSVVRVAPNIISISNPDYIPIIYNIKETFPKSGFYPLQSPIYQHKQEKTLFSETDPDIHRADKRKVGSAYSTSVLLEFEEAFDRCVELFLQQMGSFSDSGQEFDLGVWLQYLAFDVVGEVSFGKRLGFLDEGKDVDGMIAEITSSFRYFTVVGMIPEWHKFLLGNPIIKYLTPSMGKLDKVLRFTIKTIHERAIVLPDGTVTGTDEHAKDMLSRWSRVQSSDPLKMKTRDIVVHLSTNVLAGSDTTAIALRSILSPLLCNPQWMERVVQEIDRADKLGLLSSTITYRESTNHLPSTHAAIKEAMRLHPPTGIIQERHVPEGGVEVDGYYIPAGTIVGINPWVTNRDARYFSDPDEYRPARWTNASPEKLREMESVVEFVFGGGSRKCIGRNISIIEMSKLVPQFLRQFTLELAHPDKPLELEGFSLVFQRGLVCRVRRRA